MTKTSESTPESLRIVSPISAFGWLIAITLPFVIWGAVRSLDRFSNDIRQWLPKGFTEAQQYEWFTNYFGVDEMIVVSWEGCHLHDERLKTLAATLRGLERESGLEREKTAGSTETSSSSNELGSRVDQDSAASPAVDTAEKAIGSAENNKVFSRILITPEVIQQIIDLGVRPEVAIQRCQGIFLGLDQNQGCLVAIPTPESSKNRTKLVELFLAQAQQVTGLPIEKIHLGGPTIDGAAIDSESKRSLRQFVWVTAVVVLGLTWIRNRSLLLTMVLMMFAGYNALLSLAVVYWTGGVMNLTMIMLPTLVFVLSVSTGVHMMNYFLKRFYDPETPDPVQQSIHDGRWPVFLSAFTTALGMVSLATSQILPIKWFGFYSGVVLMLGVPVILYGLPFTLGWMMRNRSRHVHAVKNDSALAQSNDTSPWIAVLIRFLERGHGFVIIVSFAAVIGLGWGISWLQASVKLQDRFADSTKIILDYIWLEEKLGPLVPMEVVIRIDRDHPLSAWDRMTLTQSVEQAIRANPVINASYSAATFRPATFSGSGPRVHVANREIRSRWEQGQDQLIAARLVARTDREELWRISLRINAMNELDYGVLLDTIKTTVGDQLKLVNDKLAELGNPSVSAVITGSVPMIYKAQHQVMSDLVISFIMAFLMISVVMMIVTQGFWAGLISMIPNVFPPLTVFGALAWLGVPIEIGSVMTASVALGIAVDDTIHFLAWYRRGLEGGLPVFGAVRYSFQHCAKSMVDSTLICGLGMAPFMFSVFMPTVRFARLMAILLLVALIGDLVLLPALLLGPLGVPFLLRHQGRKRGAGPLADPGAGTEKGSVVSSTTSHHRQSVAGGPSEPSGDREKGPNALSLVLPPKHWKKLGKSDKARR